MKIIEQNIVGKRGEARCEDGIIVTDHFVAVIDGSTSKSSLGPLKDGRSGGQIARDVVKTIISDADPDFDLETFCHQVTEMIQMEYRTHYGPDIIPQLEKHPEDRFSCSAIVFSLARKEIWMIGDCQGLIINRYDGKKQVQHITNEKPQEHVIANFRSKYLNKAMTNGVNFNGEVKTFSVEELRRHDVGRDIVVPLIVDGMKGANKRYSVFDGFPVKLKKCKVFSKSKKGSTELVFATDGYPRLYPTLKKSEDYLQNCLEKDPLFIRLNPMTKGWMEGTESFDDRTYIRFTID